MQEWVQGLDNGKQGSLGEGTGKHRSCAACAASSQQGQLLHKRAHVLLHNVLFDLTLKKPLRKSCSAKKRTCGGLGEQAHTAELAVDHLGQ